MRSQTLKSLVFGSLVCTLTSGFWFSHPTLKAHAHGALIDVTPASIDVTATFDNGEPMVEAQVLVYAPTDLATPWAKGNTDSKGQFSFVPDAELAGRWEITVRQAGHGGTTSFEVGDTSGGLSQPANNSAFAQKGITIAAVIWGFVGTALFFSGRSSSAQSSSAQSSSGESSSSKSASSNEAGNDAEIETSSATEKLATSSVDPTSSASASRGEA